jgi:hypothetical protein
MTMGAMSFSFISARGSLEIPWLQYTLLRDNVVHHLEGPGAPGEFVALHRISSAVGQDLIAVSAASLCREMRVVSERLLTLPVSELAISAPTRSILQLAWPAVTGPASAVVGPSVTLGALSQGAETLGDVFGGVVEALLDLTTNAEPDEQVEVFEH